MKPGGVCPHNLYILCRSLSPSVMCVTWWKELEVPVQGVPGVANDVFALQLFSVVVLTLQSMGRLWSPLWTTAPSSPPPLSLCTVSSCCESHLYSFRNPPKFYSGPLTSTMVDEVTWRPKRMWECGDCRCKWAFLLESGIFTLLLLNVVFIDMEIITIKQNKKLIIQKK